MLEPWNEGRAIGQGTAMPELEDEPDEWEVEEVIAYKEEGEGKFYLINGKAGQ
jgi:hypothetical protein